MIKVSTLTCTIHFIKADGEEIAVEGKVFGKIAHEPVKGKRLAMTLFSCIESRALAQVDQKQRILFP